MALFTTTLHAIPDAEFRTLDSSCRYDKIAAPSFTRKSELSVPATLTIKWRDLYDGAPSPDYDGSLLTCVPCDVPENLTFAQSAPGEIVVRIDADARAVSFLYCGEQFDADLGLYYLRARLMNPLTGRFWTADSYEGLQQDPASLHKYLYCGHEGVNASDPSGHITLVETMVVGAIISVAALVTVYSIAGDKSGEKLISRLIRSNRIVDTPLPNWDYANDPILQDPEVRSHILSAISGTDYHRSYSFGIEHAFTVRQMSSLEVSEMVVGETGSNPLDYAYTLANPHKFSKSIAHFHTHPRGYSSPSENDKNNVFGPGLESAFVLTFTHIRKYTSTSEYDEFPITRLLGLPLLPQ